MDRLWGSVEIGLVRGLVGFGGGSERIGTFGLRGKI